MARDINRINIVFMENKCANDRLGNNRIVVNGSGAVYRNDKYYPYGGMTAPGSGQGYQQFKYNGKEYDPMHGLDEYDYGTRQYDPAIGRFTTIDPLCEKYCHISPYTYCAGNPVRFVDPDGKRVWVFAIKLPDSSIKNWFGDYRATHTFVVVQTKDMKIHRFEYGPKGNSIIDIFSGMSLFTQCYYQESGNAVNNFMNGIADDNIKNVEEVSVPAGKNSDRFDHDVIQSAEKFKDNKEITYRIIPTDFMEGNCNTGTTSLLVNAGTPLSEINKIGTKIKGIKTGFGTVKAWTKEQRKRAWDEYFELKENSSQYIFY